MLFQFTGFDGNYYEIEKVIPNSFYEYNYYLIFSDRSKNVRLYCFNDELTVRVEEGKFVLTCPEGSHFRRFSTNSIGGSWTDQGEMEQRSFSIDYIPVYASENLLNYKELIMTNNFTIPVPEVVLYTLSPIVEEVHQKENIVESAFYEIFGILPVLIVVFISFIGIRKGINYLSSLLKRS